MKFTVFVLANIHISILEHFCSTFILEAIDKISSIVFIFRYLDGAIAVPFALSPGAKVLYPIQFYLFACTLFEPIRPVSFVNDIILFRQVLYHTITFSFIVFECSRVYIFTW